MDNEGKRIEQNGDIVTIIGNNPFQIIHVLSVDCRTRSRGNRGIAILTQKR